MNFPMAIDLEFLDNILFSPDQSNEAIAERLRIIMMPWLYF